MPAFLVHLSLTCISLGVHLMDVIIRGMYLMDVLLPDVHFGGNASYGLY
jgi:hypothetical protein